MNPSNIFLIRHGESEGNVNKDVYLELPDYKVLLTKKGKEQASNVGKFLNEFRTKNLEFYGSLSIDGYKFYVSPYWRTRQTFLEIKSKLHPDRIISFYEDPRLREQEWGPIVKTNVDVLSIEKEQYEYGKFYYRIYGGESCADVYDRISDFLGTFFRDCETENSYHNVCIITHGMAIRLFLMRFFHTSVEEFETWRNPRNCEYFHLKLNEYNKYDLITPIRIRNFDGRNQFDWGDLSYGERKLPVRYEN